MSTGGEKLLLTERFARFLTALRYEDIPPQVLAAAEERVTDTLGAAFAGSRGWEHGERLKAVCRQLGGGSCGVIGDARRDFSSAHAAMICAAFAHALELDDGHKNAGCHAGAVVVPTALVVGRELGCSGAEVLTAVVAGYEVVYRIASHMNPAQLRRGFHPSSNCGVYGAMAAAGKLMGLDEEQMANGLGQAGMLACGLMEATKSGQSAKCIQVGAAAYNGILAARLAQTGMEGCRSALEGSSGMFAAQSEDVDVADVCRDLGSVYHIGDTYVKLYPACRHAHPGIEAVLELAAEEGLRAEQVAQIRIGTHQVAYELAGLIKAPRSASDAKFSLAYGAAVALLRGGFGTAHLEESCRTDPEVLALAEKVTCTVDPAVQARYPRERGARVEIELTDGRCVGKELYALKGSPERPVGWEELAGKFRANAGGVVREENVEPLLALLRDLRHCGDIERLWALMTP